MIPIKHCALDPPGPRSGIPPSATFASRPQLHSSVQHQTDGLAHTAPLAQSPGVCPLPPRRLPPFSVFVWFSCSPPFFLRQWVKERGV